MPPAETVTLRNRRAQMLPPIHLGHAEVCAIRGECMCQHQRVGVVRRGAKGESATAIESRRFPSTLTLCAKGTEGDALHDLPVEVLHAVEVQRAVAVGHVAVERVKAKPEQAEKAPVEPKKPAPVSPELPPAPPDGEPVVTKESV